MFEGREKGTGSPGLFMGGGREEKGEKGKGNSVMQ